jgi:hypothetical protein
MYKSPINPITNSNPMSSHWTRDNTHYPTFLCRYILCHILIWISSWNSHNLISNLKRVSGASYRTSRHKFFCSTHFVLHWIILRNLIQLIWKQCECQKYASLHPYFVYGISVLPFEIYYIFLLLLEVCSTSSTRLLCQPQAWNCLNLVDVFFLLKPFENNVTLSLSPPP